MGESQIMSKDHTLFVIFTDILIGLMIGAARREFERRLVRGKPLLF